MLAAVAGKVAVGNGTLRVRGELEAAGRKVPLSFEARVRELDAELEVDATTLVDHRLLGMTWSPLRMLRLPSTLQVKARLTSVAPERRPRRSPESAARRWSRRYERGSIVVTSNRGFEQWDEILGDAIVAAA